jgi:hypothetical protein
MGLGHLLLPSTAAFKLAEDGKWTSRVVKGFQLERFLIWHAERPITDAMNGLMRILTSEIALLIKRRILQ